MYFRIVWPIPASPAGVSTPAESSGRS
jgi:hypothetical protein